MGLGDTWAGTSRGSREGTGGECAAPPTGDLGGLGRVCGGDLRSGVGGACVGTGLGTDWKSVGIGPCVGTGWGPGMWKE